MCYNVKCPKANKFTNGKFIFYFLLFFVFFQFITLNVPSEFLITLFPGSRECALGGGGGLGGLCGTAPFFELPDVTVLAWDAVEDLDGVGDVEELVPALEQDS